MKHNKWNEMNEMMEKSFRFVHWMFHAYWPKLELLIPNRVFSQHMRFFLSRYFPFRLNSLSRFSRFELFSFDPSINRLSTVKSSFDNFQIDPAQKSNDVEPNNNALIAIFTIRWKYCQNQNDAFSCIAVRVP